MKDAIRRIVGRTIKGVVVKESDPRLGHLPKTQVFLIFADDSYYELYGEIRGAGGVDTGGIEDVRRYLSSTHHIVLEELAADA